MSISPTLSPKVSPRGEHARDASEPVIFPRGAVTAREIASDLLSSPLDTKGADLTGRVESIDDAFEGLSDLFTSETTDKTAKKEPKSKEKRVSFPEPKSTEAPVRKRANSDSKKPEVTLDFTKAASKKSKKKEEPGLGASDIDLGTDFVVDPEPKTISPIVSTPEKKVVEEDLPPIDLTFTMKPTPVSTPKEITPRVEDDKLEEGIELAVPVITPEVIAPKETVAAKPEVFKVDEVVVDSDTEEELPKAVGGTAKKLATSVSSEASDEESSVDSDEEVKGVSESDEDVFEPAISKFRASPDKVISEPKSKVIEEVVSSDSEDEVVETPAKKEKAEKASSSTTTEESDSEVDETDEKDSVKETDDAKKGEKADGDKKTGDAGKKNVSLAGAISSVALIILGVLGAVFAGVAYFTSTAILGTLFWTVLVSGAVSALALAGGGFLLYRSAFQKN